MVSKTDIYDETDCIGRIADSDSEAFRTLFRHYYPKTVIFLNAFTKDDNVSEDIAQDIFLKIWTSRAELPEIRNFGAWLYIIARNAALMHLRKKRPSISLEDIEIIIDGFIEEQCESNLQADTIRRIVESMPPKRKEIYMLSRERGLTNAEIAKQLDVSKKTVENHLNLALKEIRNLLAVLIFFI